MVLSGAEGWIEPNVRLSCECRQAVRTSLLELATDAIVKVNCTVSERAVRQEIELRARAAGESTLSSTYQYGMDEQIAIVHKARPKAWFAIAAPPIIRSSVAESLRSRISDGSKLLSSRVLEVQTESKVVE